MKRLSKDLFSFGVTLVFVVIAIQFVWNLLIEFKAAIALGLLILGGTYLIIVIRRISKLHNDNDDNLHLDGWD